MQASSVSRLISLGASDRNSSEDPGGRTAWRTEIGSEWFPALLPGRLQEAPMQSVTGILTSMCGSR